MTRDAIRHGPSRPESRLESIPDPTNSAPIVRYDPRCVRARPKIVAKSPGAWNRTPPRAIVHPAANRCQ
jgi:hypothetical protein